MIPILPFKIAIHLEYFLAMYVFLKLQDLTLTMHASTQCMYKNINFLYYINIDILSLYLLVIISVHQLLYNC